MKKATLVILIFLCFTTFILICGCTEQNNNGGKTGKTITMTAKEFFYDQETIQELNNTTINFKSLNDGDTLVIRDTIFKISYEYIEGVINKTIVIFVWDEGNESDSMFFEFEGNITGSYFNGEQVKITVKIKRVSFSYQGVPHDMELYEEQWVDEEYFNTYRYKPLPRSCISKI